MTTPSADVGLWTVLEVYLAQRRALGFRLVEEERHARRFLEWLQAHGHPGTSFTVAQALSWAQGDGSLKNSYQRQRLSAVRGLARYCHAIGLNVQVPPANVLPTTRDRRRPHIFTQGEVDALIDACSHAFTHPLVQATMAAVIALLAVTGMDRSRFGGGWDMFRGFLILEGTDDGIDTEGVHGGVQSVSGRVRVE